MKLTLIGTGAIYTKYHSACTLINDDLLIDTPNGTVKQLLKRGFKPEKIKTVLITHFHGDHMADTPFLLKYLSHIESTQPITIYGPKGIKEQIIKLFQTYYFENEQEIKQMGEFYFEEVQEGKTIELEKYKIEPIRVQHGDIVEAYGYSINHKIGLTGDTGPGEGVSKIWKQSEIMIADCSLMTSSKEHMGIEDLTQLISEKEGIIIPTHLRETTREELKKQPINRILLKEDGDEIEC